MSTSTNIDLLCMSERPQASIVYATRVRVSASNSWEPHSAVDSRVRGSREPELVVQDSESSGAKQTPMPVTKAGQRVWGRCSPHFSLRILRVDKPVETDPLRWPETTFHRTTRGAWKSILQYGVLVGGGSRSKLAKAHIYMSEYRTADDRYQTGQRRQNPTEIEIDLRKAILDGFIYFRTTAKSILAATSLKPEYLLSITDTDEGRILWHKNLAEPQQPARGSTK